MAVVLYTNNPARNIGFLTTHNPIGAQSVGNTGIKVWSGSTWGYKPVKVWSGAVWLTKPVKVWNGSTWITKG